MSRGRRRRRCLACEYRFDTVERPLEAYDLSRVLVGGDPRRPPSPFSAGRLRDDLSRAVLRLLPPQRVEEIARQVTADLDRGLRDHARDLSEAEQEQFPGYLLAVPEDVIRDLTESALRPRNRMAHVMYALVTRGREDVRGRRGFADADAVLDWLHQPGNYANLRPLAIERRSDVGEDVWAPPARADRPDLVIKRARGETKGPVDRVTRQFSYPTFGGSIERALAGRARSEHRAAMVAEWVLWGLQGQRVVLTSQLSVGVMDCLRRLDDIAYLRWAVVAKNITSVTDLHQEAVALLTHPSPRLRFDPDWVPRPRPTQLAHAGVIATVPRGSGSKSSR